LQPKQLHFDVSPLSPMAFDNAVLQISKLIQRVRICVLDFRAFGGDAIKSILKASPDSFMQLVLQQAYYNLCGHVCATYETASTRKFKYICSVHMQPICSQSLSEQRFLMRQSMFG
jgi:carnitine O-acetyltransferase